MFRTVFVLLLLLLCTGLFPESSHAQSADAPSVNVEQNTKLLMYWRVPENMVAETSAHYFAVSQLPIVKQDTRVARLKAFFEYHNSALSPHAEYIVNVADEYYIPWTLIPAISGVESTFCKHIPYNSYNCWGWRNGDHRFSDYQEAIAVISKALRTKYFDRGATTPERISPIYAPPSKTWGSKVRFFMEKIESFPVTETPPLSFH